MNYHRLLDTVHIENRWHIGELINCATGEEINFIAGAPLPSNILVRAELDPGGRPLDFCLTSFAAPVCNSHVGQVIAAIAGDEVQRFPIELPDYSGYEALNATHAIECLDEEKSKFIKWSAEDKCPDRTGRYRMVTYLQIRAHSIPADAHFFRIAKWSVALIVSDKIKNAMESVGCFGAVFEKVT